MSLLTLRVINIRKQKHIFFNPWLSIQITGKKNGGNKSIKYVLITNAQECFKVSRFSQTATKDEDAAQAGIGSK